MKEKEPKIGKVEKVIRLLDYLKEYTDENNPASIPQIERYFRAKGYTNFFGTKNTRQRMIKEMAIAMNTDVNGNLLPKENWRVIYNDFIKENTPGTKPLKEHHIVNLYYRKEFQDAEVVKIIESINQNSRLSNEEIEILVDKIRKNLANNNFMKRPMSPSERTAEERRKRVANARIEYLASLKLGNR